MNLHKFPRRGYVQSPTPIEPWPRLAAAVGAGIGIWAKRDDLLPGALGGSKTRKLDFSVARALAEGADALVTSGAVQSNHCRLTLAWAIREGLECHLVLEERVPGSYDPHGSGNNLIFNLLGAHGLTVVPGGADVRAEVAKVAGALRGRGRRPFVIPGGAADPLGALGYAACAQELAGQMLRLGRGFSHVVCATGSGGTQAGLLAGLRATSTRLEVVGINVRRPRAADQAALVEGLANDTLALLEAPGPVDPASVLCVDRFLGPGYSLADDRTVEAIRLLARTEAVLADPVYTGKALAGLIGLAREGFFPKGSEVLFLHTGGFPALFSHLGLFPEVAGIAG
jgi:D-cysteine desulfhydrase